MAVTAGEMALGRMGQLAMERVGGVLLDLSGTLHIEDTPTPSAVAALKKLRAIGLPLRFITNTTKESKRSLHARLQNIGFNIKVDEIFTSLSAARGFVEREALRPLLLLEESAKEDFEGVLTEDPNAVVVGLAPSLFDYGHLNDAFRLLQNGGRLVAIHKGRYFRRMDGLALGPGPFVAALEYASGQEAVCLGKPEPAFFESVLADIGSQARETIMIGDDAVNDIQGAQAVGMKGILVKTGKYCSGDETSIEPPPAAVCKNFAQAVELIIRELFVQINIHTYSHNPAMESRAFQLHTMV